MFESALLGFASFAFICAALLGSCTQDEVTKFCLSAEGTHQDCGMACMISKDEDACTKWEKMTIELCDKVGKGPCQEICEADNNEYACAKVESM